jgi:hypothetical protein
MGQPFGGKSKKAEDMIIESIFAGFAPISGNLGNANNHVFWHRKSGVA